MELEVIDNSEEVRAALKAAALRALERCGLFGEGAAKDKLTENNSVATGNLRNSISHKVVEGENTVYIGTNVHYAPYVELGTGKYASSGGRPDPWVYKDSNGNWHHTNGQRAKPYLKPAVADNGDSYRGIIKDEMENA